MTFLPSQGWECPCACISYSRENPVAIATRYTSPGSSAVTPRTKSTQDPRSKAKRQNPGDAKEMEELVHVTRPISEVQEDLVIEQGEDLAKRTKKKLSDDHDPNAWRAMLKSGGTFEVGSYGLKTLVQDLNHADQAQDAMGLLAEANLDVTSLLKLSVESGQDFRIIPAMLRELLAAAGYVSGAMVHVFGFKEMPGLLCNGKVAYLTGWQDATSTWEAKVNKKPIKMPLANMRLLDLDYEFRQRRPNYGHREVKVAANSSSCPQPFLRKFRRSEYVEHFWFGAVQPENNEKRKNVEAFSHYLSAVFSLFVSQSTLVFSATRSPREGEVVMRGPCWRWGDEDGGPSSYGTVWAVHKMTGTVSVYWHSSNTLCSHYQYEVRGDLRLAPASAARTAIGKRSSIMALRQSVTALAKKPTLIKRLPAMAGQLATKAAKGAVARMSMVRSSMARASARLSMTMGGRMSVGLNRTLSRSYSGFGTPMAQTPTGTPKTFGKSFSKCASLEMGASDSEIDRGISSQSERESENEDVVEKDDVHPTAKYRESFATAHQTVVIIEWDDVLFPSTWLRDDRKLTLDQPLMQQKALEQRKQAAKHMGALICSRIEEQTREIQEILEKLCMMVERLLRQAAALGHIVLVSLCRPPYITDTARHFYPRLPKLFTTLGVRFVYASTYYNPRDNINAQGQRRSPRSPKGTRKETKKGDAKREGETKKEGESRPTSPNTSPRSTAKRKTDASKDVNKSAFRAGDEPHPSKGEKASTPSPSPPETAPQSARSRGAEASPRAKAARSRAGTEPASPGKKKAEEGEPGARPRARTVTDANEGQDVELSGREPTTARSTMADADKLSANEMLEEGWAQAKGRALCNELMAIFGGSGQTKCRNIISICDSDFERQSCFHAMGAMFEKEGLGTLVTRLQDAKPEELGRSSALATRLSCGDAADVNRLSRDQDLAAEVPADMKRFDLRTKVVKIVSQPVALDLGIQIRILRRWLPQLIFLDDDCDVDFDAIEDVSHVNEIDDIIDGSCTACASCAKYVHGLGHPQHGWRKVPLTKDGKLADGNRGGDRQRTVNSGLSKQKTGFAAALSRQKTAGLATSVATFVEKKTGLGRKKKKKTGVGEKKSTDPSS